MSGKYGPLKATVRRSYGLAKKKYSNLFKTFCFYSFYLNPLSARIFTDFEFLGRDISSLAGKGLNKNMKFFEKKAKI